MIINKANVTTKSNISIPCIPTLKQMSADEAEMYQMKLNMESMFAIKHKSVVDLLWQKTMDLLDELTSQRKQDGYNGKVRPAEGRRLMEEGIIPMVADIHPTALYEWFDGALEGLLINPRNHDRAEGTLIDFAYYKSGRRHAAITPIVIKNMILVEMMTRLKKFKA